MRTRIREQKQREGRHVLAQLQMNTLQGSGTKLTSGQASVPFSQRPHGILGRVRMLVALTKSITLVNEVLLGQLPHRQRTSLLA